METPFHSIQTADRRASKLGFTQETWMMKIHLHLQNQNDVTCLLKIRSQLPEAGPGLAKCQFLTKLTLLLDMKIFYIAAVSERIFPQYFRRWKAKNSLYCICLKCNLPFLIQVLCFNVCCWEEHQKGKQKLAKILINICPGQAHQSGLSRAQTWLRRILNENLDPIGV